MTIYHYKMSFFFFLFTIFLLKSTLSISIDTIDQLSPSFLAPGTGFVEDNLSTDRGGGGDGFRMIQAHYICCALYFYYYCIVIYNEMII